MIAAALPALTRALIATAQAGNVSALALIYKLHAAYETDRWEIIDETMRQLETADDAGRLSLVALLSSLIDG